MTMQAAPLSNHQQSVMATLLPHTMVKSEEQPTSYQVAVDQYELSATCYSH